MAENKNKSLCAHCGRIIQKKGGRWMHSKRSLDLQHDAKPDSRVWFDEKGYAHERKNPDKRKCANCGKMFMPDNPNDKSENVCSSACVREWVRRGGKGRYVYGETKQQRKNPTLRKQNARTSHVNENTLIFSPREIDRVVVGTGSGGLMMVLKDGRSLIHSKRGWEFEDRIVSGETVRRRLMKLYGE